MSSSNSPAFITVENGNIIFGGGQYYVPLTSCETWEDIVGWSLQLSEKSWVDSGIISSFIILALSQNGFKRPSLR
ncbi:MAG: hypothetical protein JWS10_3114 [Cypionkella sp.]|uniref:hypothetical protein n=1 Tax=Cypionkella sp. TaxID=2811411 RepID=UPI00262F130B|nr:hypothetical protein [Cypionkella sp.]MDB5660499.1 hypothetical protein [Cypionkella sp.]